MKPSWWFKTTEEARTLKKEPQEIEYLKIATGETYIHTLGTAYWMGEYMDTVGMHACGITHWRILTLVQAGDRREYR